MFIRKIQISNFMIHSRTELQLFPMTIFVGSNNSGKSALFEALLNLSAICTDPIPDRFATGPHSYRSKHYNGVDASEPIRFEVDFTETAESQEYLRYEIAYRQTSWDSGRATYAITYENLTEGLTGTVLYDRDSGEIVDPGVLVFIDSQTSFFAALRKAFFETRKRQVGLVGMVASEISRFGKFRLDPTVLSKPGPLPNVFPPPGTPVQVPWMGWLGQGLASVLYVLDRTRDPRLGVINQGIATAIDGFSGFRFNAIGNDLVGFSAEFEDDRGIVEAPNLSAGTLSLIGWLTLLFRGDPQPVVMLEEPELGLTPRSTRAIYEAMRQAARSEVARTQLLVALPRSPVRR